MSPLLGLIFRPGGSPAADHVNVAPETESVALGDIMVIAAFSASVWFAMVLMLIGLLTVQLKFAMPL